MKTEAYLIVDDRGHVEVRKRKPILSVGEVSIRCKIEIPSEYFSRPTVSITIPIPDRPQPADGPTVDLSAVRESVEQAIGLPVEITLIEAEQDDSE